MSQGKGQGMGNKQTIPCVLSQSWDQEGRWVTRSSHKGAGIVEIGITNTEGLWAKGAHKVAGKVRGVGRQG